MFKYALLTLLSVTGLFAADIAPSNQEIEIVDYQYIRLGTGMFAKKRQRNLACTQLGLGTRFMIGDHVVDVSTDVLIHPSYQGISTALGYSYSPECLKGFYVGPAVKIGSFIYDYNEFLAKRTVIQFPLVIGYSRLTDRGFLSFMEAQIAYDGFVAISSGIGF